MGNTVCSYYSPNKKNNMSSSCFKFILNNGCEDGMTNQCLWISILDYLRIKGHVSDIDLISLRTSAGLDSTTTHTMFDIMIQEHEDAINRIANMFDLSIQFYPVDSSGSARPYVLPPKCTQIETCPTSSHNDDGLCRCNEIPRPGYIINPSGTNIVSIGQFGSYHFNLITSGYHLEPLSRLVDEDIIEKELLPALPINGKIEYIKDLTDDPEVIKFMLELIDAQSYIQFLEEEVRNCDRHLDELYMVDDEEFNKIFEEIMNYRKTLTMSIVRYTLKVEKLVESP